MELGLFASGNLGFLCLKELAKEHFLRIVFTDKLSTDIISFATEKKIPLFIGNPRKGAGTTFLSSRQIYLDLVVSINYLFLIDADLIAYPRNIPINFHGSLLPRYRGRTPHVWAIINNEKYTGITAHFISLECDAGAIIDQIQIPIDPLDTGGSLLMKFNAKYPDFVKKVIERFRNGKISGTEQDHSKATFYGKRTPESGMINWSWHRERIYNWVRAQAAPYPGAYSFYDKKKITIDKIEFSDLGYKFTDPDGYIIEGGENPVIKTPNGAIRLIHIREIINFQIGKTLQ